MPVEEIFSEIVNHMAEGILYHRSFYKAYDFLGLFGFAQCQTYHAIEETESYHKLLHYFSTHYHKLLQDKEIKSPELIPSNWYKYTTMDVDAGTKRSAIRELMTKWISWEKETKNLYQTMRQKLYEIGEIAAALEIDKLIIDVSEELKHAEKQFIKLESIGYDLPTIIDWQQPMYKKYKKVSR